MPVGGCAPNEPGGCVDADEDGTCAYLDLDDNSPTVRFAGVHPVGDDLYVVNCDLERGRWRDFAEGTYVPDWSRCFGMNVCSWYDLEAWSEREARPEFMSSVLDQCASWTYGRIDGVAVVGGTGRACDPPDAPPPALCWAVFVTCVDAHDVIVDCDGTCVDTDGDFACDPSER